MIRNLIIASLTLTLCQMSPVWAAENEDSSTENISKDDDASDSTITSMDAYNEMGEQTGNSLRMAAEYANQNGNFDKAIKLCQKALDKEYDDMDIHKTYAEALEEKLKTQKNKDHELLNKCVTEWVIVYRTEVGDEKGISFHGIDPFGHFYQDEDRSMLARTHLISVAGRPPKPWETDAKYMKWVNRPTTAVAGQLLSTTADKKSNQ